ncbi:MAG: B12-binding domain-containing radical SAM protein [Bradymonadales bacterium]|nr:B12-binding domain-containing radical SAM protein [Bradymonadales bacterium]
MTGKIPAITLVNLFKSEHAGLRILPWACLMLQAALRGQGLGAEIRDLQFVEPHLFWDPEALAELLDDSHPMAGISLMVDALPLAVELCRHLKARRPERTLILGGPGVTAVSAGLVRTFPFIDAVVRGEGEQTLPELMLALGGGTLEQVNGLDARVNDTPIHTPDRPLIDDLDQLPEVDLTDLDLKRYSYVTMTTSRGCPYRCSFCDIHSWQQRRVRIYSPQRVVSDLLRLQRQHGIGYVALQDDSFLFSRRRVEAILAEIEAEGVQLKWGCFARVDQLEPAWLDGLVRRGLQELYLGIEAGSDRLLERMGKGFGLRRAIEAIEAATSRLRTICSFLWGFPDESLVDLFGTIKAMHWAAFHGAELQLGQVVPLAGSELYRSWPGPLEYHDRYPFCRLIRPPLRAELQALVKAHPDLFPAFYSFPTPDQAAKWDLVGRLWLP